LTSSPRSRRDILPSFRTALSIEDKGRPGSFDPVTAADHAAESGHAYADPRHFPTRHHRRGIRRERADAELSGVLDPIGRHQVVHLGHAGLGHADALLRSGEPVFGVMNQPFTRERSSGDGGRANYRVRRSSAGCACAPAPISPQRSCSPPAPRLMNASDRASFERVDRRCGSRANGGDCYAMHAGGGPRRSRDRDRLKPYDVRPLVPIIIGGRRVNHQLGGRATARRRPHRRRGDKRVHAAALAMLAGR